MQFYPIEKSSTESYKRLYYSPVSDFKPDFYKSHSIGDSINFLSRDDVNKTLASKKMEHVSYFLADGPPDRYLWNITTLFVVTAVTFIFFGVFGSYQLNDPFNRNIEWCQREYILYDSILNKEVAVKINAPCKKHFDPPLKHSYAPMILGTATAVAMFVTIFIRLGLFFYKQWRTNYLISSFNANLELNSSRLSIVSDVMTEIAAKDIACIFPYLENDQLRLLKFSHLKKAYKYWENHFKQKLEASLFSKQQLSIWRLFEQFKNANHKTQIKMLRNSALQDVIASEPLFFEMLVRQLGSLNLNDERITKFTEILQSKILIPDFEANDLITMILEVSAGKKLRDVIENSECKNLIGFDLFLKTGKLKFQNYYECYEFLKLATVNQHHEIAEWLEGNLTANFVEFFKDLDLSLFLEDLENHNLESLKLKIDQHLEKTWGHNKDWCSEDFEQKFIFAKKNHLFLTSKLFKDYFIDCAQTMSIGLPFDGKRVEKKWTQVFNKCEILFGEDKKNIVQFFEDRIATVLIENPFYIEDIAKIAEENKNYWLIGLLKHVYDENPDKFSDYWLSPFSNELLEII